MSWRPDAGQGLFGYEPWIEAVRQEFFEEAENMISGGQDSNKEIIALTSFTMCQRNSPGF